MAKDFRYQRRSASTWEKHSERSGFDGFIKDQYRVFQPKRGDNMIRILPPTWEDADHYGLEIFVHYGIGPDGASVLCLQKMKNKPCPICKARAQERDEDLAREMRPVQRTLVWLLDRNTRDRDATPLLWAMPATLDNDICKIAKDATTGEIYEIDNPDEGYDVQFEKEGEQLRTKYKGLQIARRASSVSDRALDYVQDNPLPDVLRWRTADEVDELFAGGMAPRRGGRDDEDEDRRGGRSRRDDDDRGSRRSSRDDDDRPSRRAARDEEDDAPRRSRRDDDERPSRRAARDEEDDAPRTRRNGRDDEDDAPRGRRGGDDDDRSARRTRGDDEPAPRHTRGDDEDEPRRSRRDEDEGTRGRARGRGEDEDERPARGRLNRDEPPDDDEAPPPRSASMRQHLQNRAR